MPVGEQQVVEVPELKDEQPDAAMEQQQPQVGEKRLLEDADGEAADGEAAGGEPAKTEEGEDAAAAEAPAESTVRTIGYRTFNGGQEAYKYYHGLIRRLRKFQPLNEVTRWAGAMQPGPGSAPRMHGACAHLPPPPRLLPPAAV